MDRLKELKLSLKKHLSLNDFKAFFEAFNKVVDPGCEAYQMAILQQGRLARVKNQERSGVISDADADRTYNRVRYALIETVDGLDVKDLISGSQSSTVKSESSSPNSISDAEKAGLKSQLSLLVERMNRIREALALETDPSRKFAYEKQIQNLEAEIEAIKQKLN